MAIFHSFFYVFNRGSPSPGAVLQRLQVPLRRDAAAHHRPRTASAAAGPHAVPQGVPRVPESVEKWKTWGNLWKIYGKPMENLWKSMENHGEIYGKSMENPWKIYGKSMENPWKIYGKSMENQWKIYGKPMENLWKSMESPRSVENPWKTHGEIP